MSGGAKWRLSAGFSRRFFGLFSLSCFRSFSPDATSRAKLPERSRHGRLPTPAILSLAVALLVFFVLTAASCGTTERVTIARGSRLPEETKGFAQVLTDEPIKVGIIGTDVVAEKNVAGYAILNVEDLAQLVRNTEELLRLKSAGK